jgi:hypothetical protein
LALSLKKIDKDLLSIDDPQLNHNLVAVAVQIDDNGIGRHSGLIIGVDRKYYIFHFTGEEVELKEPEGGKWIFCKELEIINPQFSEAFLAHCEMILEESNPSYGFVFEGSYWIDGNYFSDKNITEITTCVGFCISTIAGFIYNEDQYFKLDDWDSNSVEGFRKEYTEFFEKTLSDLKEKHPNEYEDIVLNYLKRITPSEYTSSAFINTLPIRKTKIDKILGTVETAIKNKRLN